MWTVWVVFVLFLAGISLYASNLAKNEEDQLFLDDSFNHVKSEQDAIAAKLNKIQPLKRAAIGLAAAMTLVVIVYYILDMVRQFQ